MDLSFVIVFGLLLKTVASAGLREDDRNTGDALQILTVRLDRMTLDLHRLESRLQTQIEELKSTVNTLKATAKDSTQKLELQQEMKAVIEESVQKQAATVYRTLAAEKRQIVEFRRDIQSRSANFEAKTNHNITILKGYLEDTSLKLSKDLQTGTKECREKVNSELLELFNHIQGHNETLQSLMFQEKKMAELATANSNSISSLSSNIALNTNSISPLSSRVSTHANDIAQVSSKVSSNANSISSLSSRISSNSDRISGIISDRGAFSSFTARLTQKLPNFSKDKLIVFDEVVTNRGYDYSPSTGIYTAPVAGYYIFLFNVQCYTNEMAHVHLEKNGARLAVAAIARSYDGAPDITGGNAGIVYLSKGDKVGIVTSVLQSTYDIWPWRTSFSGALLYAT